MSRLADKDISYISIEKNICNQCIHIRKGGITCDAFPTGIPEVILTGEFQHTKPFPGDGGIQFEAVDVL